MWIRNAVYNALASDPALNAAGLTTETLFPNFAPDSPAAELTRWWVLRWGAAEVTPGRDTTARPVAMAFWAYDREKDYGIVSATLVRARAVFAALVGYRNPDGAGAFIDLAFAFSSEDLYDDAYRAVMRSESYKVVASGI